MDLLRAQEDSEMWMAYVDYVDEMVVDGFFTTIQCSLKFLLDNTSQRPEPASLFEAVLELQVIRPDYDRTTTTMVCGGRVVRCRTCDREVVGTNPARDCCVPTLTQRAMPPGSVNEYQRKLGSKRAYHAMH